MIEVDIQARYADVPPLHLLKAEQLPASRGAITGTMNQRTADALRTVIGITSQDTDRRALAAVDAALACLTSPAAATKYTDAERKALPEDLYEEHDLFFGAIRVTGNSVETFAYTMLESLRSQLSDALSAGISLSSGERAELREAFWTTFHMLWRIGVAGTPFENAARAHTQGTDTRTGDVQGGPLIRWRLGHQVFFALIQALIVSVGCLEEFLKDDPDDIDSACRLLEDATALMIGSGASLRYLRRLHRHALRGCGTSCDDATAHQCQVQRSPVARSPDTAQVAPSGQAVGRVARSSRRQVLQAAARSDVDGLRRTHLGLLEVRRRSRIESPHARLQGSCGGGSPAIPRPTTGRRHAGPTGGVVR